MLFTIPYNGSDPERFLAAFEPHAKQIHSFYFGLQSLIPAHNPDHGMSVIQIAQSYENTLKFLELCKGRFQTILCINALIYPQNIEVKRFQITRALAPLVDEFGLTAVNVASSTIAQIIHETFPELDIQTSCNTYAFIDNVYHLWHEKFGTTVFNLPREAMRTPSLLERVKAMGYISKCIVNEACIYGCPANIEHACAQSFPMPTIQNFCDRPDYRLSDILKSNFIPPHRLPEFEGRIDIAKIAGRGFSTEWICKAFEAYRTANPNADIMDVLQGRCRRIIHESGLLMKARDWPKKTLTCECKECKTCNVCQKAMEHIVKVSKVDPSQLARAI